MTDVSVFDQLKKMWDDYVSSFASDPPDLTVTGDEAARYWSEVKALQKRPSEEAQPDELFFRGIKLRINK